MGPVYDWRTLSWESHGEVCAVGCKEIILNPKPYKQKKGRPENRPGLSLRSS